MNQSHLTQPEQGQLLRIARSSVQHGITQGQALSVEPKDFSLSLQEHGAAFVTLEKQKQLRGCIGTVEANRPLVVDVSKNAWNAAFRDPRFGPVIQSEFAQINIEISILTKAKPLIFTSEDDLKLQLQPGSDGLILSDGFKRGLFLPSVWEKLPEIDVFLSHLKQKAGLPANYWSDSIQVERFHSFKFSDDEY